MIFCRTSEVVVKPDTVPLNLPLVGDNVKSIPVWPVVSATFKLVSATTFNSSSWISWTSKLPL